MKSLLWEDKPDRVAPDAFVRGCLQAENNRDLAPRDARSLRLVGRPFGSAQGRLRPSLHVLARPEPTERARRQQRVHEPIDHFLDGHAPGLPFPDSIAQVTQAVRKECGRPYNAKHA
jgi:hypothetical protein